MVVGTEVGFGDGVFGRHWGSLGFSMHSVLGVIGGAGEQKPEGVMEQVLYGPTPIVGGVGTVIGNFC